MPLFLLLSHQNISATEQRTFQWYDAYYLEYIELPDKVDFS